MFTGAVWRQHRKLIAQGFSTNAVNDYLQMFNNNIKQLIKSLASEVGKEPFNLKPEVNIHLMNSILETTLGYDIDESDKRSYDDFFSKYIIFDIHSTRSFSKFNFAALRTLHQREYISHGIRSNYTGNGPSGLNISSSSTFCTIKSLTRCAFIFLSI